MFPDDPAREIIKFLALGHPVPTFPAVFFLRITQADARISKEHIQSPSQPVYPFTKRPLSQPPHGKLYPFFL